MRRLRSLNGVSCQRSRVEVTGHQLSPVSWHTTEKTGECYCTSNVIYLRTFHRQPVTLVTVVMYKKTLSYCVTTCHR
jgi:hypothetical protein